MKFVGIDIGTYSIKVGEVEVIGSSSYQFNRFDEYLLPHDPGADRAIQVIEALRDVSGRYDHSQTKFIVGLRQEHLSMRKREFPFRERQKILKSLPFDLEDELPFNQEDVVYDAKIQSYSGPLTLLQAVACSKEQVQKILDICKDGYIDPDIISSEGFALGNMLENWMAIPPERPSLSGFSEAKRNARMLLHLGHSRSLLAIYADQELISMRTIFWGAQDISSALAKRFEVPFQEGEQALQQKGFILLNAENASKDQLIFSETIANACQPLVHELKLTLLRIESTENLSVEQIDISGPPANIRNFNALLTQRLERRTNIYNPLSQFGHLGFELTPAIAASAPIAFGLAAEGLKRPRNPAINFRRADLGKANNSFQKQWEKWRHTAMIVAIAYIAFFAYSVLRISSIDTLIETGDQTLSTAGIQTSGLNSKKRSDIQNFIRSKERQLRNKSTIEKLQSIRSPLDLINEMSSLLPPKEQIKLDILELNVKDNSMTIKGSVADKNELKLLVASLNKLTGSSKAIKTESPPVGIQGGTPFAYRLEIQRLAAKD